MTDKTPQQIVQELDKYIVGQQPAKRAVAIALRNRWRRMQLDEKLRQEIVPKNILMIGPTGVGKTEIARRLAKLADAPFIKIEATTFTEVGYVGREVESIIRDLVSVAVRQVREQALAEVREQAAEAAEERILNALLPGSQEKTEQDREASVARKVFREKLRSGEMDDKEIEITTDEGHGMVEILGPPGMEEMSRQLQDMFSGLAHKESRPQHMSVYAARQKLRDEEAAKMVNESDIKTRALELTEQTGIVFVDEIDKITRPENTIAGGDVSREGVQRDLLPLIEGCSVQTRYGTVHTDHILFIASGAFHTTKPADLIPELQGRLPIRVELAALSPQDFERILTEPESALTRQYYALLGTEGIELEITPAAIKRIAQTAWEINDSNESIGARRLHTIMERLLEKISFEATDLVAAGKHKVRIDPKYVDASLSEILNNEDIRRFIL